MSVEKLKAEGRCYEAGELAAQQGAPDYYGCHYGMRSTLQKDRQAFYDGWLNAKRAELISHNSQRKL